MTKYATKISESFVQNYKNKTPPWGDVGYIVYKRTYARGIPKEERTEEWWQTIERCCNGILEIGGIFSQEEIQKLYDHVFNLRCCFSGRALWQLGTATVKKHGADSLQNCWFVAVNTLEAFPFTMNELMLGGGVGFGIQPEYVYELPIVKHDAKVTRLDENDVDFIVPDNREGWVELLRKVLNAFFITGKDIVYSTVCIRSRGEKISSFGGVASGPTELCKGIEDISEIIRSRLGRKLRPIDCLDVMNIIGRVVVAGNVRRSAEIAIGDINDIDFLEAKNWNRHTIPNWRSMSNNTVETSEIPDIRSEFWEPYSEGGECYGMFNPTVSRKYGRLIDGQNYRPDTRICGTNPCAEITLESFEPCNLGEIFAPNISSVAVFKEVAELMYKVQKTISTIGFINEKTNKVVRRNHRLGIGITGFLQSDLMNTDWMNEVYHHLEQTDKKYSRQLGVNTSIKLTTVKPSGTLSLLAGVTSGVHPAYSEYYIRRIRFAADDPLIGVCKKSGYHVEPVKNFDGTLDMGTMVVDFPIKTPDGTVIAKEVSAIDQLEYQKWLQTYWSDNAVSVTVYYKREEIPEIQQWLQENYADNVKTVSFLLYSEHGFAQAPLEEISKERYEELKANSKPINNIEDKVEYTFENNLECEGATCPVR